MAYTDNKGITFNTFDSNTFKKGKKVSNNRYAGATVDDLADIASDNGGKLPTIINALEIDWNGAQLELPEDLGGTQTIQTTGQLLSIIQQVAKVYSPIFVKAA